MHVDFACQLERELAAVTEERDAFIASARIREANSGWRPIETVDHGNVLLCTTYGSVVIGNGQYVIALLADAEKRRKCFFFAAGCPYLPRRPRSRAMTTHTLTVRWRDGGEGATNERCHQQPAHRADQWQGS